jgi:hypothetical protein
MAGLTEHEQLDEVLTEEGVSDQAEKEELLHFLVLAQVETIVHVFEGLLLQPSVILANVVVVK